MAGRLKNTTIAAGIQELHFVGKVAHADGCAVAVDHRLVIGIVMAVAGAGIVIAPGVVERIGKIGVGDKVGDDLREGIIRRLGRDAGLILKDPILFAVDEVVILCIVLPGVRTAAVYAGGLVVGPGTLPVLRRVRETG